MAAIRDLGIVAWRDPSATIETMSGPEWNKIVNEENRRFDDYLRQSAIQARIPAYEAALKAAEAAVDKPWFALNYRGRTVVDIYPNGNAGLEWTFTGRAVRHEASDVDIGEESLMVYSVIEVGGGAHLYELRAQRPCQEVTEWTIRDVGPSVAVAHGRVYYLRPQKKLWYFQLWSADARTGKGERLEYELKDPKYNLYLQKCANRNLYLLADNNGYTQLWSITRKGLVSLDLDAIYHIPCDDTRLVLTTGGKWEIRGSSGSTALPPVIGDPYFYNSATQLILTRSKGAVRVYLNGVVKAVYPAASVVPDTYLLWSTYAATAVPLVVKSPGIPPTLLMAHSNGNVQRIFMSEIANRQEQHWSDLMARSSDGTEVPCGYVSRRDGRPRALLIVMYGAYGAPTAPGYVEKQWAPLLEAGWAIGYAFVRGGGDNGWAWAEAGRRTGRIKAIEDAEACIATIRKATRVSASHTAIYGRSAGGVLIGTLTNRHPRGDLFGMVYGEVPYLDVLQTTTNPALPLTELEYEEFGDPIHNVEDLAFWTRFSPVTNIPAGGIPDLKVLCRTGTNDTQVYAYEPVKWIRGLRGDVPRGITPAEAEPKLLGIRLGEGHFFAKGTARKARAEDCAILDFWTFMG